MSPVNNEHPMARLSRREQEIMLLVSECLPNKEIARRLEELRSGRVRGVPLAEVKQKIEALSALR